MHRWTAMLARVRSRPGAHGFDARRRHARQERGHVDFATDSHFLDAPTDRCGVGVGMPVCARGVAVIALAKPVTHVPAGSLATLRREAAGCRDCPLWRHATRTVFGEGPADAAAMLIGEQPGAQEDLAGEPFVGPAGTLLDRAMAEAGLERRKLYLTNTVKHFKYEPRGKVRLHKRANAAEQAACRQWLAAELARVQPRLVVGLGAMAAQTLFGSAFRISTGRGQWRDLGDARGLATWHPSAVLRMPHEERRHQAYAELVADLHELAIALAGPGTRR